MEAVYYTADEAMEKLNKPRSTFFKEVGNGLIPFELEPGRQRGKRFPKTAIDILARRQQVKYKQKGPTHLIFSPTSPADMWAEIQIGTNLYGEDDIVPYDKILDWRDVNDEMHMSVKDRGQVAAYSCLMPLEESVMFPLIHDKIRERDIPSTSIKQWTDPYISVYVSSVTVKPTGNPIRDKEVGRFLIKQTIKWALSLNRQYDIKNWYGIGATPEGQALFEALSFTEIASVHKGARKGYLLQDNTSPGRIISKFLKSEAEQNEQRNKG